MYDSCTAERNQLLLREERGIEVEKPEEL